MKKQEKEKDDKPEAVEGNQPKEEKRQPREARRIVRLAARDLNGDLTVIRAIRGIPGVSYMFSNAVSKVTGLGSRKMGDLTDEDKARLEDVIKHPEKHAIPAWLYNRRHDPVSGATYHIVSSDLELKKKVDINEMKKIKSYKGVRHSLGLPVRGQRTRSSFRSHSSVGVVRKKEVKGGGAKSRK